MLVGEGVGVLLSVGVGVGVGGLEGLQSVENLRLFCPKKYAPGKKILGWAKKNKVNLLITQKPDEAVKNSDCVMTDKWVSMNDKVNKKTKKKVYGLPK